MVILLVAIVVIVILAGTLIWYSMQTPSPANVVVIRFAGWSAGETEMKNYQKIISDFEAANPTIKVKYEVITQMFHENILGSFAAGAAPDIFYLDSSWAPIFISQGVVYPVGDKLPSDFINQFYSFLLDPFKGTDGKIYGLPKDWSVLDLFYNKKILSQAGVPEPTSSWTWDDLFNYAKIIHDKTGIPGLVVQSDFNRWLPYILSYGAPSPSFNSASDASYFDNPKVKQAISDFLNKVKQGREAGYIVLPADVGASWNGEAFGKQLAAMTIEGSWTIPYLADQFPNFKYGSDWDISLVPNGPSVRATMAYTVALAVNAKSQALDAALKFIQFVEGANGQKILVVKMGHTLPSIKSLSNDPDLWPSHAKELSMVGSYTKVQVFFYGSKTGDLEGKFNQILSSAMQGKITIDEAINELKQVVVQEFS
jgi:multiple sugar transport system substrate-binding protein